MKTSLGRFPNYSKRFFKEPLVNFLKKSLEDFQKDFLEKFLKEPLEDFLCDYWKKILKKFVEEYVKKVPWRYFLRTLGRISEGNTRTFFERILKLFFTNS